MTMSRDDVYTVKETLDRMERKIDQKFAEHSEIHKDILSQVKYTNGRVRFNEKMIWVAIGGVAVLSYFFSQERLNLTSQEDINRAVADSFEQYLELNGYAE